MTQHDVKRFSGLNVDSKQTKEEKNLKRKGTSYRYVERIRKGVQIEPGRRHAFIDRGDLKIVHNGKVTGAA